MVHDLSAYGIKCCILALSAFLRTMESGRYILISVNEIGCTSKVLLQVIGMAKGTQNFNLTRAEVKTGKPDECKRIISKRHHNMFENGHICARIFGEIYIFFCNSSMRVGFIKSAKKPNLFIPPSRNLENLSIKKRY